MKVTLQPIGEGEDEILVRYHTMNRDIEDIVRIASGAGQRILCSDGEGQRLVDISDVLYAESVERATFLYTRDSVYRTACSLQSLEVAYTHRGLFRCAKSMLLNINRISQLRSEAGGRIDARLENGEHVIISRKYAKELRQMLKGED